ncbi:hypothetical protein L873DRAFT_1783945 [Choiromyces venosus 120613-1]|uniref:Uncharacterized protein n=1 Tax=Choiromyces venosus 120613-1 TaxID=1336337 RepID=A0A3N4ITD1_9PEZI|nr:hypothetical protein L873DRAFT_1783945 [Choiromyces venosus 120613-1]
MSIDDLTVLWETIQDRYKSLVKEQGRNICGQLARISLKESGKVKAYFLLIDSLCADLAVIQGMPVSEEERITAAMHGVLDEWNPVKMVIRGNVDYTYAEMKHQLKDYKADLQKSPEIASNTSLYVRRVPTTKKLHYLD